MGPAGANPHQDLPEQLILRSSLNFCGAHFGHSKVVDKPRPIYRAEPTQFRQNGSSDSSGALWQQAHAILQHCRRAGSVRLLFFSRRPIYVFDAVPKPVAIGIGIDVAHFTNYNCKTWNQRDS